ncbi:putative reverse transcriptase domain-containing protein [Tanacetum coccineum]
MSIRDQTPIPFLLRMRLTKISLPLFHSATTHFTSYSSPLAQIPSPPQPVSSPLPVSPPLLPASPTYPLGYRAAMIRLKAKSLSTSHPLPLPSTILLPYTRASVAMMRVAAPSTYILAPRSGILPSETPSSGTPPLLPISLLHHHLCFFPILSIEHVGESSSAPTARPTGGFRADYEFVSTLDDEIRRDPKREVGYRITDTWDKMVEDIQGTLTATDVAGLSHRMIDFVPTVRQDTNKIYGRLDDALDDRSLMSGHLNMLRRDRRAHARTARLMESEARLSREAWTEIGELRAANRRRQTQLIEALTLLRTLQTQMAVLQKNGTKRTIRSTPATITTPTTFVTDEQLKRLIDQGVADALAARNANSCQNDEDSHDSGTGVRRSCRVTQWFERIETVFRISSYSVENQINFSTCTLLESALTWWNSHVKTFGHDVAYEMTWTNLKKKMTDKYCLRGEVKKLEGEIWNLNFDVLIGMDWLAKYQAVIVCAEKIVRIPLGNETLIFHGCLVFLAHVTTQETEDKSEKKRLEEVPFIRNFPKEHEENLKAILEFLKKEELYEKFSKCQFWIPKVQFLGHVIDSQSIHVDPAKIESIKDWASPKTPTEIHQFLGVKFDWGDKAEAAFQLIKHNLCSAPILALPEGRKDFIVYCDALIKGLGAVLMQREKVIAYASRQLKIHGKN